jgi:hypothetical protein
MPRQAACRQSLMTPRSMPRQSPARCLRLAIERIIASAAIGRRIPTHRGLPFIIDAARTPARLPRVKQPAALEVNCALNRRVIICRLLDELQAIALTGPLPAGINRGLAIRHGIVNGLLTARREHKMAADGREIPTRNSPPHTVRPPHPVPPKITLMAGPVWPCSASNPPVAWRC